MFVRATRLVAVGVALVWCAGCNLFGTSQPTTDLHGKATHTGTLFLLRVDDAWNPEGERGVYKIGSEDLARRSVRFVPVRGRTDVAGIDSHDRIVTKDDFVTVTLKSAFIKYFKELGGDTRRGEIAVVLSFEAGSSFRNSFLVYASQNQTLASMLSLDNWPVIGPVKIDGDSLKVRVVVIELDQAENEAAANLVREIATLAATAQPQYAPAAEIVADVAETLIRMNQDDVILDQRFALQRVSPGSAADRNPLLFGTYVLMLQEDRLAGSGAEDYDQRSALPPRIDRLRYDTWNQRVFMAFNYLPRVKKEVFDPPKTRVATEGPAEGSSADAAPAADAVPALPPVSSPPTKDECPPYQPDEPTIKQAFHGSDHMRESGGWFPPDEDTRPLDVKLHQERCLLAWVNTENAVRIRRAELGYENPALSDLDVLSSYSDAMLQVYKALSRGESPRPQSLDAAEDPEDEVPDVLPFEFPVVEHNTAFSILAQYPSHTHLVVSIDRSLGGEGASADSGFASFADFMRSEIESARDENVAAHLTRQLRDATTARRKQNALFEKVAGFPRTETDRKVCVLASSLPEAADEETGFFSDAAVYNEIFHASGEVWSSRAEAEAYLSDKPCSLGSCDGCAEARGEV